MTIKDFTSNLNVKRILAIAIGLILARVLSRAYAEFSDWVGADTALAVLGVLFLAGVTSGIHTLWTRWRHQPNATPDANA